MPGLRKELRQRLLCEYRYFYKTNDDSMDILKEAYGVPKIIDDISVVFRHCMENAARYMRNNGKANAVLKIGNDVLDKYRIFDNLFFDKMDIEILVGYSDTIKGNFAYKGLPDNFENGKLKAFKIDGNFFFNKDKVKEGIYRCTALFAHEMLHAYEDWNRLVTGKGGLNKSAEKYGYKKNTAKGDNGAGFSEKQLSQVIYYLTPFEIRAYCAQLIKKNENMIKNCTSSKQAFDIITRDSIWQNYEAIEKIVDNMSSGKISCSIEDIEGWWHDITGNNISYNRICIYLKDKIRKARRQIINNVGKVVNELALQNSEWNYFTDTDDNSIIEKNSIFSKR